MNVYEHLTTLLLANLAGAATLIAIWASTSRRHWFWRALAIWAVVAAMLPISAYEPAIVFALALSLIACTLVFARFFRRRNRSEVESIQFGLRDVFLAVVIVGMSLAILRVIARSALSMSAYAVMVPAVSIAALGVASYWLVVGPRRIWAFCIVIGLLPLLAFLLWPRITWLDNVLTLGLHWERAKLSFGGKSFRDYLPAFRLIVVGMAEFVAITCATVALLLAIRNGGRYAGVARASLAAIAIAWICFAGWICVEMRPLAPFPPSFQSSDDRGADIVQIAARIDQVVPRSPAKRTPVAASAFPPSLAQELNELYEKASSALAATNSMPFDAQTDLNAEFYQRASKRVLSLRELGRCFIVERDEAESKGDRAHALEMALLDLRLGTMCCRNCTSGEAQVGCVFLGVPFSYFARNRGVFDAEECGRIAMEIGRVEAELEPIPLIQKRDLAYYQREYGWQGRLSSFIARGETERLNARAVQLSRNRWHAMSRLLLADMAIRCYERDHSSWPQSLEQLVPQYLRELPIDPYSKKPFGYLPGDDDFSLYSTGPDRVDNGGSLGERHGFYGQDGYDIDLDSLLP